MRRIAVRAKLVLAVAQGLDYTQAARSVGRKSNDAVSRLVARFNQEGLEGRLPRYGGGGFRAQYQEAERARILREFERIPEAEHDGMGTWSLTTLQRALRQAKDGLPKVSTYTILNVLHEAGYTWQQSRTWAHTGQVTRKRKSGTVVVTDADAQAKNALERAYREAEALGIAVRLLLVMDNRIGHKNPEWLLWCFQRGILPIYTPLGGRWLNMAESIQRLLKRRALDGFYPHQVQTIIDRFEALARGWNAHPTPFVWGGNDVNGDDEREPSPFTRWVVQALALNVLWNASTNGVAHTK